MQKIRRTRNNLHVEREGGIRRNTDAVHDQLIITASCSFPRALTPNYWQFEPERQRSNLQQRLLERSTAGRHASQSTGTRRRTGTREVAVF